MSVEEITLHGHRVSYRREGWGPVILLIHGITGSSQTWDDVIPLLSDRYTVIAPDLLGHGDSAKPRGDYSLGAYASGIRDLMQAVGHERATVVGHSLGGGVAMQLAYQFPEMAERLVLVSSGGLGREVNLFLRAATLPGSEWVLPLLASNGVLAAGGSRRPPATHARHAVGPGPRGDVARVLVAGRRRRAPGVHLHAARESSTPAASACRRATGCTWRRPCRRC